MVNTKEELPLRKLIQRLIEEDEENQSVEDLRTAYAKGYSSSYRNYPQSDSTDQLPFYMSFTYVYIVVIICLTNTK